MKIQESAENYLESILILSQKKGEVRSIDIVNYLDFSKPSVSVAMKNLRLNGYINMVRVNNVIARAKKSDDSLADIIFDCGFDSMTTFYRNYSRFYDRPPTEVIRT